MRRRGPRKGSARPDRTDRERRLRTRSPAVYADAVPHPERLTCALVVLLTAGCLGPASAPLACDGSSEEVAFAYQVFNASLEPGAVVMEENGGEHLFIDGACRYWAYYQRPGTLRWTEVRSGVLTGELLSEVNASLISRRWTDVDGERAADPIALRVVAGQVVPIARPSRATNLGDG